MQAKTAVDYLINFVMQISHGVYLTAPFVKTDLILIFPGRLKRMLLPALASEGLRVSKTHFSGAQKTIMQKKTQAQQQFSFFSNEYISVHSLSGEVALKSGFACNYMMSLKYALRRHS